MKFLIPCFLPHAGHPDRNRLRPTLTIWCMAKMPVSQLDGECESAAATATEEQVQARIESFCELTKVRDVAKKNIEKAQQTQKKYYDKRHASCLWEIGDKVLVINSRRLGRKGDKLAKRLNGPYKIAEVLPKGAYKLDGLKTIINSRRLVAYVDEAQTGTKEAAPKETERETQPHPQSNLPHKSLSTKTKTKLSNSLGLQIVRQFSHGNLSAQKSPERLHKTRGDGNCFFRAVAYCVTGCENEHLSLRNQVVRHMLGPIKEKMEGYLNRNMDSYADENSIMIDGTWATDAEILGAASLLQTDILVYSQYGSSFKWAAFPASLELGNWSAEALFLDNSSGQHFDVAIS